MYAHVDQSRSANNVSLTPTYLYSSRLRASKSLYLESKHRILAHDRSIFHVLGWRNWAASIGFAVKKRYVKLTKFSGMHYITIQFRQPSHSRNLQLRYFPLQLNLVRNQYPVSAEPRLSTIFLKNIAIGAIVGLGAYLRLCPSARAAILYQADYSSKTINKIDTVTRQVTPFYTSPPGIDSGPVEFAFDNQGNLYFSSYQSQSIERISADGQTITTVVTGIDIPYGLAFDKQGNLYVSNAAKFDLAGTIPNSGTIRKISPDGTDTLLSTGLAFPIALVFDDKGNLYESDHEANQINKIDTTTGVATPFATGLNVPMALAFDKDGNLFAADRDSKSINKILPDGTVIPFATTGFEAPFGLAFDADNNLFATDFILGTLNQISADGRTVTPIVTGLNLPLGIIFAPTLSTSTAVPEPFTVIGTIVGGTAALRLRKRLTKGWVQFNIVLRQKPDLLL